MSNIIRKCSSGFMLKFVGNRTCKGLKLSRQKAIYKQMKSMQWKSINENLQIQKEKLYKIVCFAIENVPYYQKLGFSLDDFSDDTIFTDIKKLPILTKDIIRKERENLYPRGTINDWIYNDVSGGTTGEPVPFRHSGYFFDCDQASKLLFDEWVGREIGDLQIRLWGSERDIIVGKKDWLNKIYRAFRNEIFLNTFMMTDKKMSEYIDIINKKRPQMILAYVQSARELAQFAMREKKKILPPGGVMTSAGTLDEYTHDLLTHVFKCPILNRYGSREMGDMACSCKADEGLHINMFSSFVEILDDNYNRCPDGEMGNIIVTSLTEYAMPLIRYNIGDVGVLSDKQCSCGRGLLMLKRVNGRNVDIFKTRDGNKVDGEYFTHLFYNERRIKQFQVIQDNYEDITIKIVLAEGETQASVKDFCENIKQDIYKVMGLVKIIFDFVNDIPVTKSGKRAYTISHIK